MFERFTEKSRRALFFARYFATEMRSVVMQPEHLLEGVLEAAPTSVSDAATTIEVIRERLATSQPDALERPTLHEIIFSPALKRVLHQAAASADALGHRPIRPEHLLIAILTEEQSPAAEALRHAGVERSALEARAGRSDEQLPDAPAQPSADRHSAAATADGRFSILHDFAIAAPAARIFDAISLPAGLDQWWTERCTSVSRDVGAEYQLHCGAGHDWRAVVTACEPPRIFEIEITQADDQWRGTRIAFELASGHSGRTSVRFVHAGWAAQSDNFRGSTYCWAMYLRILRRHLEHGETVPYNKRLDA